MFLEYLFLGPKVIKKFQGEKPFERSDFGYINPCAPSPSIFFSHCIFFFLIFLNLNDV
jgi:hypothetical protein